MVIGCGLHFFFLRSKNYFQLIKEGARGEGREGKCFCMAATSRAAARLADGAAHISGTNVHFELR